MKRKKNHVWGIFRRLWGKSRQTSKGFICTRPQHASLLNSKKQWEDALAMTVSSNIGTSKQGRGIEAASSPPGMCFHRTQETHLAAGACHQAVTLHRDQNSVYRKSTLERNIAESIHWALWFSPQRNSA